MTLLIDAAPLVALADPAKPQREGILDALTGESEGLVVPAPATAEIDHLLGRRPGSAAMFVPADMAAGRFSAGQLERGDCATRIETETRYADLDPGLADCALVALAARHRTTRILSLDDRRFRAGAPLHGEAWRRARARRRHRRDRAHDKPRTASVIALTDAELYALDR